jgi:hypothetical protein
MLSLFNLPLISTASFYNISYITFPDSLFSWRLHIRWRRIFHSKAIVISGFLAFPYNRDALIQRMYHLNSFTVSAFFYTRSTEPAFIWIQNYWRLILFRVRHQYIPGAGIHTEVTTIAFFLIKLDWSIGSWPVRHHKYFFTHLFVTPRMLEIKHGTGNNNGNSPRKYY